MSNVIFKSNKHSKAVELQTKTGWVLAHTKPQRFTEIEV